MSDVASKETRRSGRDSASPVLAGKNPQKSARDIVINEDDSESIKFCKNFMKENWIVFDALARR